MPIYTIPTRIIRTYIIITKGLISITIRGVPTWCYTVIMILGKREREVKGYRQITADRLCVNRNKARTYIYIVNDSNTKLMNPRKSVTLLLYILDVNVNGETS